MQSQNILKNNQTQKHQTLIIFYWDDKILYTNYLSQYNFVDLPTDVLRQLNNLDILVGKLLRKALNYENTYIVSNATKDWVGYSSKLYLPKVNAVIKENVITVISARREYEDVFSGDCQKWKIEAFKDQKKIMMKISQQIQFILETTILKQKPHLFQLRIKLIVDQNNLIQRKSETQGTDKITKFSNGQI